MLQIGWATREMTPERPAMVQGQKHRRIAREAMDPLTVTALAITGGNPVDCALLISCDLAYVSGDVITAVRARLSERIPSLPTEKILMNATHTHTSMVFEDGFYTYPGGEVMAPAECAALIVERAADAAVEAWERRAPQQLGNAFGHAVVGHNRRALYFDGHAQMYGQTNRAEFSCIEGYEDHSLDMLFTWDAAGQLTGIVLDIPCPSQVDEGLEVWSADYWHDLRQELRARYGASLFVLPLCGAAGDQSPHFLLYGAQEEEMRRRRGVTERREIALRVADAVTRALDCTQPFTGDIPFAHAVRQLELTPRQINQVERDWAEHERKITEDDPNSWWPQRLQQVVDEYDGKRTPPPVPQELHVLRIGNVALGTSSFELLLDFGLRIKARSPAAQTFIVQLAHGRGMYLPTQRAVEGGGYGAMPAVSEAGPEGGQELVEATLRTIAELFA